MLEIIFYFITFSKYYIQVSFYSLEMYIRYTYNWHQILPHPGWMKMSYWKPKKGFCLPTLHLPIVFI